MRRGAAAVLHLVGAALFAAGVRLPAPAVPPPLPGLPPPPPKQGGRGHGSGKLRKGTRPRKKKWGLVQEIHPRSLPLRQWAGQQLVRLPSGIWVWPKKDQQRYQDEHP